MPEQRHETLSQLMDQLLRHQAHRQHSCDCTDVPYYSAQDSSLVRDVPQLMEDIREDTLHFASEAFGSQPSVKNIWIGDERSVSSMHADPYENLYTVVTGIKIFYLRPPCDAALLDKPVLQNARWKASANEMHDELCESCVQPVEMYEGWSLVKEEGETAWIDENSCEAEYDQCLQVHLHAGDVLYLPALWYHRVAQQGITIAINWWYEMWFGRDWVYRELCSNLRTMLKARNLSSHQMDDDVK
ncbi:JmjC domain-containing protein E [Gracilariopsis chorda]|uniref:JmjC domain-containing protein E n=1 Tax=Gracilariopsis chorda TaxID=448386 RepID=A0A2V3IJW0_9FLOR|nr:JmjC domain-containing protein E [Gracilariopsis chorda]|eukprot:PXF42362.1 JmjC domain-containing protein E [Gracilariopsis chorda]